MLKINRWYEVDDENYMDAWGRIIILEVSHGEYFFDFYRKGKATKDNLIPTARSFRTVERRVSDLYD